MAVVPYMPFYVADYMADTQHLTTEEHGAYLLLIMTYWQSKKPLRASSERLANAARMPSERWATVEPVLSEFFEVKGGFWTHKRIEYELAHFKAKSEANRRAAQAGVQRRLSERSANAQRTLSHTDADADADADTEQKYSAVTVVNGSNENLKSSPTNGRNGGSSDLVDKGGKNPSSPKLPPNEPTPAQRHAAMHQAIHDYMSMDGTPYQRKIKPPDEAIVRRCLAAIGETPVMEAALFLRERFVNHEQSPRHPNGPRGYAWFAPVLLAQFNRGVHE